MEWARVRAKLDTMFQRLREQVEAVYPEIRAGTSERPVTDQFRWQAAFIYEGQDWEDLIFDLFCGPATSFPYEVELADLQRRSLRDIIRFEIERGTGLTVAKLPATLLPEDRCSAEYERSVMDYVNRTFDFITAQTDAILDALREPFLFEDPDSFPPPSVEGAQLLTEALHRRHSLYWDRIRNVLKENDADPLELTVGHVFRPRDLVELEQSGVTPQDMGLGDAFPAKIYVLIGPTKKVLVLGLDWKPLNNVEEWVKSIHLSHWRELDVARVEEHYRAAVDAGMSVLDDSTGSSS